MISAIRSFFDEHLRPDKAEQENGDQEIALATAALLYEVVESDHEVTDEERARVLELLDATFDFSAEELDELANLARREVQEATDLFQFTRLINENFDEAGRVALIRNMWRVALADGEIHHYEEHLIRRVSDLLHLHHKHFIGAKLEVQNSLTKA